MDKFIKSIQTTYLKINKDIIKTPLEYNYRLSKLYNTNIYYKREDQQITRSFKIRGSLNKIKSQENSDKKLICASAGNHAQGFAYSCNKLNLKGTIYVPQITTLQKINRIKYYGKDNIKIKLFGDNFQECLNESLRVANITNKTFIHPYDDMDIIKGQATIGLEIYNDIKPDFIVVPVGGGGLISGISEYSKIINPNCKIIGVEPVNANSLEVAIKNNKPIQLNNINTFVDGAAVPIIGNKTFDICKKNVDSIFTINNKKLCHEIINAYQDDGIILEPAGALSISVLEKMSKYHTLEGKNIVLILSGGNNDISRYNEIMQLNLEHLGLRHYFIVQFNQKPGELQLFINNVLKDKADIIRFEYIKKTNKYYGNVLIGIELIDTRNLSEIIENINSYKFSFKLIEYNDLYYDFLI